MRSFGKLRWLVRLHGVRGSVSYLKTVVLRRLRGKPCDDRFFVARDTPFDEWFGVETAGLVAVDDMDVAADAKLQMVEYRPVNAVDVAAVLDSLPIHQPDYQLVDLGCGKGRVLLIASQMRFREVVGVELSSSLAAEGEKNVLGMRRSRLSGPVRVQTCNASLYQFSAQPTVVFLFNPFSAEVLQKVLANLTAVMSECGKACWIVYANARHRHVFSDASEFWRIRPMSDDWWAIYEWVGSPSNQVSSERETKSSNEATMELVSGVETV